jgi:hypothetical protein
MYGSVHFTTVKAAHNTTAIECDTVPVWTHWLEWCSGCAGVVVDMQVVLYPS